MTSTSLLLSVPASTPVKLITYCSSVKMYEDAHVTYLFVCLDALRMPPEPVELITALWFIFPKKL